nr:BatA domain-containing protein [Deltaproteobacteria bacterium]
MTFAALSAAAVIGLALATAAAVVAMYLLRRTPRPHTVCSVAFWRRAAERSRPRSPLATRIPWVAMLLSLAIATLLVLELGDPRPGSAPPGATVVVLAADRSMAATDARGRRRLDDAVAIARATAQAGPVDGRVALVRAGARTSVLAPHPPSRRTSTGPWRASTPTTGPPTSPPPSPRARHRARRRRGGRVVVVIDRDDFLAHAATPSRSASRPSDRPARPSPSRPSTRVATRRRSASTTFAARCARTPGDGRAPASSSATAAPSSPRSGSPSSPARCGSPARRGFSSAQAGSPPRLEDVALDGGRDALARDDLAYAALSPVAATRVLLVTPGDRFLAGALAANPSVDLEVVDAAGLASRRASLHRYHVVVLDRVAPDPPVDHPALLLVGAAGGRTLRVGRELVGPRVTAVAAEHRVLAGLRLDQIRVARARALIPTADDRVLVRSGRDALAIARDRDGVRVLALGFDTEGTDLVQRIAFPLFMHNALVWLDRREREFHSWRPGSLRAPARGAHPPGPPPRASTTPPARASTTAGRAIAVSAADASGAVPDGEVRRQGAEVPLRVGLPSRVLAVGAILAMLCGEWALTGGEAR